MIVWGGFASFARSFIHSFWKKADIKENKLSLIETKPEEDVFEHENCDELSHQQTYDTSTDGIDIEDSENWQTNSGFEVSLNESIKE